MELIEKMDSLIFMAKTKLVSFLYDEKGDTNFISVLVLLGIALALAGVFLTFKDQVLEWVNNNIGGFFTTTAGKKGSK